MDNKQAIENLQTIKKAYTWSSGADEALDMAMKALQADGDLISRQAVLDLIDELARAISDERCCYPRGRSTASIMEDILQLPSVAIPYEIDDDTYQRIRNKPCVAIPSADKTEHWKDFAVWVAKEIFDDEWEYNKDAFAEIACRKLNKLGIVKAKGDEWELVEPQEISFVVEQDLNEYMGNIEIIEKKY